jgi:hypothetical protein
VVVYRGPIVAGEAVAGQLIAGVLRRGFERGNQGGGAKSLTWHLNYQDRQLSAAGIDDDAAGLNDASGEKRQLIGGVHTSVVGEREGDKAGMHNLRKMYWSKTPRVCGAR